MGRRKKGEPIDDKAVNFITLCCFGGDIDHGERNCQHPKKIREFGLDDPYDVAVVIPAKDCLHCSLYRSIAHGTNEREEEPSCEDGTSDS